MISGIEAIPVKVEVDISTGMPAFDMVGYLSSEVKEARERVRTALHNCGFCLPAKRITINLSPANIRKSGTGFDLPIAIALLLSLIHISSCKSCKYSCDYIYTGSSARDEASFFASGGKRKKPRDIWNVSCGFLYGT